MPIVDFGIESFYYNLIFYLDPWAMSTLRNIWNNERGFLWMLGISIITLASTQLPGGVGWPAKFILRVGFFLFMLFAINSSSLTGFSKSIGYLIASLILVLAVVMIRLESEVLNLVYTILVTGYIVYVIALVIKQILAGGVITTYKIAGGIAAYILLGLIWASLYLTLYILHPDSFKYGGERIRSDEALQQLSYFSFVTLTTIGYGDITSVGSVARVFVMLEGLIGQLFPAVFIAKLVSQQIEDSKRK